MKYGMIGRAYGLPGIGKMSIVTPDNSSRVMLFIDLRNVVKSSQKETPFDTQVDFVTMSKLLANNRRVVGAYVFDGTPGGENAEQQERFHHCLKHQGFRLITRNSIDTDTREQKEVDVSLACEMLDHAIKDHYDVAIIVSGDRDFVPAIEFVQRYGKMVEVASFEMSKSNALIRSADASHNLSSMPIMVMRAHEEVKEEDQTVMASSESAAEASE